MTGGNVRGGGGVRGGGNALESPMVIWFQNVHMVTIYLVAFI